MQVYKQIVRVDSQPEALIKASNTYQTACDVFGRDNVRIDVKMEDHWIRVVAPSVVPDGKKHTVIRWED